MSNILRGQIVGKTQGFYTVEDSDKILYTVKLKGTLKKDNNKLNCVIGDYVIFDKLEGIITEILKRHNLLLRPLIANIDFVSIVASIKEPNFDFINFQKNLLWFNKQNIDVVLVLNKVDIASKEEIDSFIDELKKMLPNLKYFLISTKTDYGIKELLDFYQNKTVVLSGQSGVGKSSLTNRIIGENYLEVGEISKKTKKGKNTTIITKYFEKDNIKIFDTPGYSMVIEPEFEDVRDIMYCFDEFREYLGKCKYRDCIHIKEPNCMIIDALKRGQIYNKRYEFYVSVVERWKNERN